MILEVACLIKATDKEAGCSEAVVQEVSGATEPKKGTLENGKMIVVPFPGHVPRRVLSFPPSVPSRNFHLEASLNLHTPETELAIVFTSNISE